MIEFARPEFLFALPAAAIPWIIHLLNRRRFRRVRWAAMEYVMLAERSRRRRIRFQHLLLLLLRTLGVALIVLLFAQPRVVRAVPGLGGARGRLVVILDDSASMAQRTGQDSVFERAVSYVQSLAGRAADAGSGFAVYLPGREAPFFAAEPFRPVDANLLGRQLEGLQPSSASLDMAWLSGLGARTSASVETRFYVVSDLRAADWGADKVAPGARRALAALQQHGPVTIVDCGAEPGQNAGIAEVPGTGRFAYAGATRAMRLVVQNDGPAPLPAGVVTLSLDGGQLPTAPAPAIAAGGRAEVPFGAFLGSPGGHTVRASLGRPDTFSPDDVCFCALDAVEQVPVLLVEGAAGSAFYLRTALQPAPGAGGGLRPEVVAAGAEPPADLSPYAAVFLCDVSSPAPWRDALVRYVREGGRLVAFVGGGSDPDAWNRTLFAADGGLPVCRVAGSERPGEEKPAHVSGADFADPLLRPFADWQALFAAPAFWQYFRLDAQGGSRAPLRFDDPDASPALLIADQGAGLVAVFPFGPDDSWTDWPRSELGRVAYLSLMQWLVESGGPAGPALNLVGGSSIRYPLDASLYRSEASLVPPSQGARAEPVALGALPQEGSDKLYLVSDPLRQAGIYELRLERLDGGHRSVFFAVNVSPGERLLAKADAQVVLGAATAPGRLRVVRYGGPSAREAPTAASWWRGVAGLALALLALESLLAFLFGNPQRRRQ